jgi:adenylosuccinate synthase
MSDSPHVLPADCARALVLSGPVCAGKTTLAHALVAAGMKRLSTRDLLLAVTGDEARDRSTLQRVGERLDREQGGRWVVDALRRVASPGDQVVVDAIRTADQLSELRGVTNVVHCHLWAPRSVLERRQTERHAQDPAFEPQGYERNLESETERRVVELARDADVVINTEHFPPSAVAAAVAALLGLPA